MPAKLSADERLTRAASAYAQMEHILGEIAGMTGRQRTSAWQRANSRCRAVLTNTRPLLRRGDATSAQRQRAQQLCEDAQRSYDQAWQRLH